MNEEFNIDFACITETWIKNDRATKIALSEYRHAKNVEFIRKDRGNRRGGGVAIAYNIMRMRLKRITLPGMESFEVVAASGKQIADGRLFVIICCYLPPKMTSARMKTFNEKMSDAIENLTGGVNKPLVVLAGDMNKKDITPAIEDFPELVKIDAGPTRGTAYLDEMYVSFGDRITNHCVHDPLQNKSGIESDHGCLIARAEFPRAHHFTTTETWGRVYTTEAETKFGHALGEINWSPMITMNPSQAADYLDEKLSALYDRFFPLRRFKKKSTDLLWLTPALRRKIRRKKRMYRFEGKTDRWLEFRAEVEEKILAERKKFLERAKKKCFETKNTGAFFKAVKVLGTYEAEKTWNIMSMFPGEEEKDAAEKAACFFNAISQEYGGIEKPSPSGTGQAPTRQEIAARLRKMKKPSSQVRGDIDRRLVTRYADEISLPLSYIFSSTYNGAEWPLLWKTETVTLIPKKTSPTSLSELRNISCTPLFSKLMETYVLDRLRNETSLSRRQFGGIKGTGVDHYLCELWQEVLSALEDNRASVALTAVDYEKAFNRLDHNACLAALKSKGASEKTLQLTASFLHGRQMRVRIGKALSTPRTVPGGSPQGSIMGNYLFCATTDKLIDRTLANQYSDFENNGHSVNTTASTDRPTSPTIRRPTSPELDLSHLNHSMECGEDSFNFYRPGLNRINDTVLSERWDANRIEQELGVPERWKPFPLLTNAYVDDFVHIEKVKHQGAISHITTGRQVLQPHAWKTEHAFEDNSVVSAELGMKINPNKTSMVCISASESKIEAYFDSMGTRITSSDEMKVLGFWFDSRPDASLHVKKLEEKFRGKLWAMRFLRDSGMEPPDLLYTYKTLLRPVIDFATPTYGPMLNTDQSERIEGLQRRALKIVYGTDTSYSRALTMCGEDSLQERRKKIIERFALKNHNNQRYDADWFPTRPEDQHHIRSRRRFIEEDARTSRFYKSPINHMRRILNDVSRIE